MLPHGDYTTLTYVRRALLQQNITSNASDDDDDLLKRLITAASRQVTTLTQRVFTPVVMTRLHDWQDYRVCDLDADLLELTALTNGNGDTISTAHVLLLSANETPKWRLQLKRSSGVSFTYDDDPEQALEIEGVWGYHENYSSAWVDTLAVVPVGNLSSGATTMTTPAADGMDASGRTRFEVGGLYRIDEEYIKVVGITFGTDPAEDTLTIRRAQLGTVAAAHAAGAAVECWRVLEDVEWQTTRLVIWAYKRGDAVTSVEFLDTNVTLKDDTLKDIVTRLVDYQPKRIRVA